MQIALGAISLSGPLTGIGQYTWHLAKELHQLNQDVSLFLGNKWTSLDLYNNPIESLVQKNPFHQRVARKLRSWIPNSRHTVNQLRQHHFNSGIRKISPQPQIYHETNFIPWKSNLPIVATIHDLSWIRHPETHPQDRIEWLNNNLEDCLIRTDQVIVVSDFVKDELIDLFGPAVEKKIKRVYNGVSSDFYKRNSIDSDEILRGYDLHYKKYILCVGTMEPRKNLKTIIQAYSQLKPEIKKDYPLIIAGSKGWLNEALNQLLTGMAETNIKVLGYVPQEDLPYLYSGAIMTAYGSIYEGFGLPVIESMACETPVLISEAQALLEVAHGQALICETQNVESWVNGMMTIFESNSLAQELATNSKERSNFFNWATTAQETLKIYQSLV